MVTMNFSNKLYVIAKVTPLYSSKRKLEEYVVSEDFFYPWTYVENSLESSYDRENSNEAKTKSETDSSCTNITSYQSSNNFQNLFCSCVQNLAFLKFKQKIQVKIDAVLFSIVMLEMERSKTFRFKILSKFYYEYACNMRNNTVNNICLVCKRQLFLMHIIVHLNATKKNIIDYAWNKKLQVQVNEKCELENAMAWLSTLGGAFSALGDSYIEFAEKAGSISLQQLHIALRLGDPLTVCRCKIYLAMSLLQRGYYKKTKEMIRELYRFSTEGEGSKDFRLKNMCIAVWNRMKYLLSQRRIKKIKAY